jgi:hypothetical protein
MPSPTQGEELIKIQAKLQNRVNLKLWSETIELADYYSSCSIQSGFLGIPTWASLDWNAEITRTSKKYDSSISISYLGPARDEKRFDDFAQFIKTLSQCSSEINLSQIKEVFISVVEPKRGYSSQVRQAIKEIKSIDNLPINLSSECLTREEYIKRLHQASLVWLAYDEKAYADGRGSGILVDCLASGSCFIARSNTTPTHYLRGNGILVNDPESGIHSLQQFLQNLDQAAKGAAKMQQHYIANYASDVMTRKILAKQITDTSNFRLGNAHLVTIKSSNGKIGENCSIETASSPPPFAAIRIDYIHPSTGDCNN